LAGEGVYERLDRECAEVMLKAIIKLAKNDLSVIYTPLVSVAVSRGGLARELFFSP